MTSSWFYVVACCLAVVTSNGCFGQSNADFPEVRPVKDKTFAGKKAGQTRNDNSLKIQLVWCPSGKFRMGTAKMWIGKRPNGIAEIYPNEEAVEVELTKGFWMAQMETTQEDYSTIVGKNPSFFQGDKLITGWGIRKSDKFPVENVSWHEAMDFCRRLTIRERQLGNIAEDEEYILPTEAQWEYACRAGTNDFFFFGNFKDAESKLGMHAWYGGNSGDRERPHSNRRTHEVGLLHPNPWGLYDIYGNVMEWTRDSYQPKLVGGKDPFQTKGLKKQVRGGYIDASLGACRSAMRGQGYFPPDSRITAIGFRIILAKTQKE